QPKPQEAKTPPSSGEDCSVQISNPFIDCENMAAAEQSAHFTFSLPADFKPTTIRVIENKMIEVNAATGNHKICIKKAVGNDDISGDYNVYSETNQIEQSDKKIRVATKGNDGVIHVATWINGEYTYSIGSTHGMTVDEITAFVNQIN
ncbi:MAG: hypothetical protein RR135_01945, partial [Oscillospiraceae bacterium]